MFQQRFAIYDKKEAKHETSRRQLKWELGRDGISAYHDTLQSFQSVLSVLQPRPFLNRRYTLTILNFMS